MLIIFPLKMKFPFKPMIRVFRGAENRSEIAGNRQFIGMFTHVSSCLHVIRMFRNNLFLSMCGKEGGCSYGGLKLEKVVDLKFRSKNEVVTLQHGH